MKRAFVCVVLFVGCGPQVEEEPLDFGDAETVEESCRTWCETIHGCCDPLGTDECSPWELTEEACFTECVGASAEFDFNDECRDLYYSNIACSSELTCEEYVEYFKGEPAHECEAEKDGRFEMVNKGCFGVADDGE